MSNFGLVREGTSTAVLKQIPRMKLKDDYILVRTIAIALNPTDWTTLDAKGNDGTLVGCDYAGIVEEVGSAVTKPFKKGDRIAGVSPGGMDAQPESGAFAQFVLVKGDVQLHVPDHITFEKASTIGSGILTAGYSLYRVLSLPLPGIGGGTSRESILIYGGSTATGTIAIQLAKMAGRKVITTCSPKHFDLMKQRGAEEVYDYRDSNVGERIRQSCNDKLNAILDCVAVESSAAICAAAFGKDGGIYFFFLGYDLFGEPYVFEGDSYPAKPEDFRFAREWTSIAERLWSKGEWQSHPEHVLSGGLQGAVLGMQLMRENKGPSGEKWVYRTEDTIWP